MATDSGGDDTAGVGAYCQLIMAGDEDSASESDNDDNGLIDTWERNDPEKKSCKEKMEHYICLFRDFCDGLEFQVKFQDPQFLKTLEKEGAGFIRLVQNCLSRERRLILSRAASPSTWERSTANAVFYRSHPSCGNHGT